MSSSNCLSIRWQKDLHRWHHLQQAHPVRGRQTFLGGEDPWSLWGTTKRSSGSRSQRSKRFVTIFHGGWRPKKEKINLKRFLTLNFKFKKYWLSRQAPRPSISNVIWVLSSDNTCQINQLFSNSDLAMLSTCERTFWNSTAIRFWNWFGKARRLEDRGRFTSCSKIL